MGQRLIGADPDAVRQLMTRAVLDAPVVAEAMGTIRLAPHQVEAAARLLTMLHDHGGAVLADATGLGKTYVAIAVARTMSRVLIMAPAALRGVWHDSLGRAGVAAAFASYEALSRGRPTATARPSLVILDEAHHARNPASRRYAALADLAWGARVLLLTATPIHNRARDLRALVALFIGSRANQMDDHELKTLIVRREPAGIRGGQALPVIRTPRWLQVPRDPETLRLITALPPALPAADGTTAHALLLLGLLRAWTSSEAALRETLRRRLRRAVALQVALESGRLPDRRELRAWTVVDDAVQLGFPDLLVNLTDRRDDTGRMRLTIAEHAEGVRAILRSLDGNGGRTDSARIGQLRSLRERHRPVPLVAFTQFADTAQAMFRGCAPEGGSALVTGRGARVASGRVTVDEIVRGFDVDGPLRRRTMPLDLLIATDVLSEGLSLRRAGVLVHLDLPWTMARLEQRVGRLRRTGSRHSTIMVYAIGPPVVARELLPVLRALQRKARLTAGVTGVTELAASLPLFGDRFRRATVASGRHDGAGAVERLRAALLRWIRSGDEELPNDSPGSRCVGVGLVRSRGRPSLVAIHGRAVSDATSAVLQAVEAMDGHGEQPAPAGESTGVPEAIAAVRTWLEEQRGRELARLATEAPSHAHAGILRALQQQLQHATRHERVTLLPEIERCRRLVISARGIGAEIALQRFASLGPEIDIASLQALLASRAPGEASIDDAELVAMLWCGPGGTEALTIDDFSDDLPRPDPPRSSSPRAARAAASG